MLVIALTGGIGSGKSTVSELFKSKNIPVIDTDIIARELVDIGKPAYKEIIDTFGETVLTTDNKIDRKHLREIIFSSKQNRIQLEEILHPLIWDEVRSQLALISAPYCIVVVPLLLENKSNLEEVSFNRILVIDLDEHLQIERVTNRDQSDESIIKNIIKSQVSRKTRLDAADDVIPNTYDITTLQHEVEYLHQKYLQLSDQNQ